MAVKEIAYEDREMWLKIREQYIGGSDAGCVVGMNPYRSAYTLWAEKTGKVPAFEGNLTTEVGAYLEEFVASVFERETGKKVRRKNRVLINDDYPFACANVDRMVVGEKALLEIKTTNSFPIMKQLRGTEFPEAYYCQCIHYLAVTGLERAYLAVLVNCREFKMFVLERDEDEIAALMTAEREFWRNVVNNTPPAADGSDSTADTLVALYPDSTEGRCDLFAYENDLRNYMDIKAQIKSLEKLQGEISNRIKSVMADAGRGESNGFKVSFASQERKTFDTNKLAAEHPEINLEDYYNKSTIRPFKVTEVA